MKLKNLLIYYYLYKFRKTFTIVFSLVFILLVSNFIYSDVVEYLKLRDKLEYLDFILPLKWVLNIGVFAVIVYLLLGIFKTKKEEKVEEKPIEDLKLEKFKNKTLRSRGDLIIQSKLK
jgi:hypothetical protein